MSWTWRARWVFFREQHRDFRSLRDFGSLTPQGSTMDNNVRLQNLRDFTVQILRPSDETIVGMGIAVSMDGQVVTCVHVVEAALGVHPRQAHPDALGNDTEEHSREVTPHLDIMFTVCLRLSGRAAGPHDRGWWANMGLQGGQDLLSLLPGRFDH